jgi:predicted 3-demethylubiquinone-9 3-methyltransferase (glyoxalase superfamily)
MQKIVPFLWFDEQAEEAVNLYTSVFKNSSIGEIARYGDDVPGPKGKVITISFRLAGLEFAALNGGPQFSFTPAVSLFVECESVAELDAAWARLSEGGSVLMELGSYPFNERFGWLVDRYGLSWQFFLSGQPQKIVPYLLFVGAQAGRAEEAIQLYNSLFAESRALFIERYGPGMNEPEGTVMTSRFLLAGQEFMAMDSSLEHNFTFTEAFSFVVNCETQAEVDYFWEKLSEGGKTSMCGWLSDRFGVWWQIVPTILGRLMSDPDPVKAGRVTQAMLRMTRLDIGLLQQAYEQG